MGIVDLFAETTRNIEAQKRNGTVTQFSSPLGHNYKDFTDDLRFSPGEIFVEVQSSGVKNIKTRYEGFCIAFEDRGYDKVLKLWSTTNHEAVDIVVYEALECRVGLVENSEEHKVSTICYDCREELLDCHCVR